MTMTDVEPEALSRLMRGVTPTYGYYRQPNGWVKPAAMTLMEELKYRREGWTPLPQYGRFDMATGYAADHPLELLFMRGGAKELCEEQIRQQGLYVGSLLVPACNQALTQYHQRHVPSCWIGAKPVQFPQLAAMTGLGPFTCRFCSVTRATIEARDQHEAVVHREEKGDIRIGESLAEALIKNAGGKDKDNPEVISAVTIMAREVAKLQRQLGSRKGRQGKVGATTQDSSTETAP